MSSPLGYLMMILHAHLPYVRHPEHNEFLEEDWLYEAMLETYIPLLALFDRLEQDDIRFRITMTLTPPLCEMMTDPLLTSRFDRYLKNLETLSEAELIRTRLTEFDHCGRFYHHWIGEARKTFSKWNGNLINGFRHFQDSGKLEIITCSATHCLLPLCSRRETARAQLQIAVTNYTKHFGRPPRGIWLAECAYTDGIESLLQDVGLQYFFVDTHGILFADPRPRYANFAPVYCRNGVAAFARDIESSKQVWSSETGYPGDADYREFYRDIGFDADEDYIRPFLHADGLRRNLGLKYHRITGDVRLDGKSVYDPEIARQRAADHAGNFMFNRQQQVRTLQQVLQREPLIVSPYDAELFGHWWFEGPWFLEYLFRKIACDQHELETITPAEYLKLFPVHQVVQPCQTSWGDKGYFEVWLNGSNDWIYRHLHHGEDSMIELVSRFHDRSPLIDRALNQASRELLLAQSSDWAFIMTTGTVVPYAEKRTRDHLHNLHGLYLQLTENRLDEDWLHELEQHNAIFPELDYHVYAPSS